MKTALKAIVCSTGLITLGCTELCFVAGTRVLTQTGPRPIESIQIGDRVWSWDVSKNEAVLRPVTHLIRGESLKTHRIQAGEQVIQGVTSEHPFWNPTRREWTRAADLVSGDDVLCWPGSHDAKSVAITLCRDSVRNEPVAVYTLTVDGPEHNYFAEGMLVHNKTISSGGDIAEPSGPCVEVDGLAQGNTLSFGEVSLQQGATYQMTLTASESFNCGALARQDQELWIEEEMVIEFDDPSEAFERMGSLEGLTREALLNQANPVSLVFVPPAHGEFEAQIHIGFPSAMDEGIPADVVQLFGTGISDSL